MIYKIMNLFCDITLLVLFARCTLTSSSTRFSNTQLHIASPITANYSQIMVRSRLACAAQCDRLPQCTAFNTTRVTVGTGESASKWQILCTLIEETRESLISSPGDDTLFLRASDVIQTDGTTSETESTEGGETSHVPAVITTSRQPEQDTSQDAEWTIDNMTTASMTTVASGLCSSEPLLNNPQQVLAFTIHFRNYLSVAADVYSVSGGTPQKQFTMSSMSAASDTFTNNSVIIVRTQDLPDRHLVQGVCQYVVYEAGTIFINDN